MSSERLSRALMSVGENLGNMANVAFTQERDEAKAAENSRRDEADRIHQESLVRLRGQMDTDAQTRDIKARNESAEADRTFSSEENKKDREFRATEGSKDRSLQTQRLEDQDRRAIEAQAQGLLANIDDREITLRDQLREGMIPPEGEEQINAELEDLSNNRRRIRHMLIKQLKSMGDVRYKDMDERTALMEAGWSPRQIEGYLLLKSREEAGGVSGAPTEPGQASAPTPNPNAISTADIDRTRPKRDRKRSQARQILSQTDDETFGRKAPSPWAGGAELGASFLKKSPLFNEELRQENLRKAREIMDRSP